MSALLSASGLEFSYGERPVLEGVSLSVEAGQFVGLVGPNGAGKTTLLHVLLHILSPQSGKVEVQGTDVAAMGRREIARSMSLVPQETAIEFAFTVRDIVAMGRNPYVGRFRPLSETDEAAIAHALATTELVELADRPADSLSGGERQRLLVARAIAQETPIVLLDEPTANLDLAHQLEVLELIRSTVDRGGCALAAIHDLSLASRYCDQLICLAGGQIVATGEPRTVLTADNLETYFNVATEIIENTGSSGVTVIPLSSKRH